MQEEVSVIGRFYSVVLIGTIFFIPFSQCYSDVRYSAGVSPHQATESDINNDGLLDLLVSGRNSGDVTIYLNIGMGSSKVRGCRKWVINRHRLHRPISIKIL